jgi:hypothetical protein
MRSLLVRTGRTVGRSLLVGVALIVVTAGCGSPTPSGNGSSGRPPELVADALRYSCGSFPFDPSLLQHAGNAEQGPDPIATALRLHLAKPGVDFETLPDTGWTLVGADAEHAELIAHAAHGLMYVSVGRIQVGGS